MKAKEPKKKRNENEKREKKTTRRKKHKKETIRIKKTVDFEKRFRKSSLLLRGEKIYRLNETAKLIWDFIDKIPPDEMVKVISEEKGIPEDEVREQIYGFLKDLESKGLIKIERTQ